MAIKVEVKEEKNTEETEFPFIGTSTDGLIVLFKNWQSGFVLNPGDTAHAIGYYSDMWSVDSFKKLKGEITLSND